MKTIKLLLAILFSIAITSCGGGGGGSSDSGSTTTTTAAETATGYFIDSAVQGLSYTSGGQSGTTDASGKFTYEVGKTVKFFIGNIVLGEVTAKGYMTPVDLVANADASNTTVLNIVRFLMTLDSDNNHDNGITIADATRTAAQSASTIDFSTATDSTFTTVLVQLNISITLVTVTDAQTHLTGSIYGLYAGTYSGSYTFTNNGTTDSGGWEMTISSTGAVSGSGTVTWDHNDAHTTLSGAVSTNGSITFTTYGGDSCSGTIDASTGAISGTCNYAFNGSSGTFTGTRQTTTSGSVVGTKFAIATTTDTTSTDGTNKNPGRELGVSAAFDGTNYLVGIQGDATANYDVTAQLMDGSGNLVGSRISTGRTGGAPHIAFNGTNYLMVWEDDATYPNDVIYGQIISTAGAAVTAPFAISYTVGDMRLGMQPIACDSTQCNVTWYDANTGKTADRSISQTGGLLTVEEWLLYDTGSGYAPVASVKDLSAAYKLTAWDTGSEIRGAIGSIVGGMYFKVNFLIAVKGQGACADHNPVGVAFDGTNYLVVWNDHSDCVQPIANWDILAQRVDESGNLVGSAFQVNSISTNIATLATVAFDGTNYLVTWMDGRNDANKDGVCDSNEGTCWDVYGQYISKSGTLVGSEFIINNDVGNQLGFVTGFNNGKYLVLVDTEVTVNDTTELFGDVYGVFVTP